MNREIDYGLSSILCAEYNWIHIAAYFCTVTVHVPLGASVLVMRTLMAAATVTSCMTDDAPADVWLFIGPWILPLSTLRLQVLHLFHLSLLPCTRFNCCLETEQTTPPP